MEKEITPKKLRKDLLWIGTLNTLEGFCVEENHDKFIAEEYSGCNQRD